MNKKYIYIAVVLVAFLGIFFLSGKKEASKENVPADDAPKTEEKADSAWIEVISGKVFLIEGNSEKELFTGDEIIVPAGIKTDKDGSSDIHFLDGSVMRVGPSSIFDITSASFEKDTGKIGVVAKLSVGRIWSKIVELATPDSVWQVETSNTVATVRGTAFGVSTDGKVSKIVGSQHKIAVDFKDPQSGKKLDISSKIVGEGALLLISEANILKLKELSVKKLSDSEKRAEEEKIFAVIEAPATAALSAKEADPWIRENEMKDKAIEKEIEASKLNNKDNKNEFRGELQKNVLDKLDKIKRERKDKVDVKEVQTEDGVILKEAIKLETKDVEVRVPATPVEIKPILSVPESGAEAVPVKFEMAVVSKELTGSVAEGNNLTFKAILYGDGKEIGDVTGKAKWEVLGPIGAVITPGIFSPKLDASVIELGEGSGFIVATWINEKTGEKILGKSPLIKVIPNIEIPADIGGQ